MSKSPLTIFKLRDIISEEATKAFAQPRPTQRQQISSSRIRQIIREEIARRLISETDGTAPAQASADQQKPPTSAAAKTLDAKLDAEGNLKKALEPIFKQIGGDKRNLTQVLVVLLKSIGEEGKIQTDDILTALNQTRAEFAQPKR